MPNKTVPFLGYAAGTLIIAYLALVSATVFQAAWQTNLAVEIHETETEISRLEIRYYDMIAAIDRTDPGSYGLTKPKSVSYAEIADAPAVTLR